MLNRHWAAAVGFAVALGSVAVAAPASAAIPPSGVKLVWQDLPTGFCLGVAGGDVTNGKPIIVWHCNGNTDQTWTADSVNAGGVGPFLLRDGTNRNKCLSVAAARKDNGAQLVIWDCKAPGADTDQLWTFKDSPISGNCTVFVNVNSSKVMGVSAAATNEGAPVIQWDDLSHPDQSWCSAPAPNN